MISSALLYRWLLASAALQSQFLGSNVFTKQKRGSYDFVIVGGGTAGCVLASRLSEIPEFSVLLLERGNSGNDFSDVNILMDDAQSTEFSESITTTRQEYAFQSNNGVAEYLIGKALGGGSTHNGMNYVRGSPLDYDTWSRMGASGWSYKQVLPYFKKLETYHPNADIPFDASVRGFAGPMHAQPLATDAGAARSFLQAARESGYRVGDYNSYFNSFDIQQSSSLNGVRSSARRAYLQPALGRQNLDVVCQATVTRILWDGTRAIGVEYERSGQKVRVYATKEVILSASALRSPQLLMVSGVGPASTLTQYGIPVVKDLPAVGRNLQDHPGFVLLAFLKKPLSSKFLSNKDITDYDNFKTGPLTILSAIGMGFTTNNQSKSEHDTRYQIPILVSNAETLYTRLYIPSPLGKRHSPISAISDAGHVSLNVLVFQNLLLAPESRGSLTIRSNSIHDAPVVDGQTLADPRDREGAADLVRTAVKFANTASIQRMGIAFMTADPQLLCITFPRDSESFYQCVVSQYTYTSWHYCGTARMGRRSDPLAVVDASLKVHGVRGLRVIDASVMPTIPRANINTPVVMIAEKGADMIKKEYGKSRRTLLLKRFDDVKLLRQTLPVASDGMSLLINFLKSLFLPM